MIKKGKRLIDLLDAFPAAYARHWRTFKHLQLLLNDNNQERGKPEIIWYWGVSGIGKSKKVRELFKDAYWKPKGASYFSFSHAFVVSAKKQFKHIGMYNFQAYRRPLKRLGKATHLLHVPQRVGMFSLLTLYRK